MDIYSIVKAVTRTIVILLNNLYAIPTYLLWMLTFRPLLYYYPKLYYAIEGIGYSWMLQMVAFWGWTAGYSVAEAGDDVSDLVNEECIVMCNHQSTADVPTMMYLCSHATKRSLARHIFWIMDILFKYTNFGWVATIHGDFFIRQGRDTRQSQLTELRDHLRRAYIPLDRTWILLFPEGGFLRKRKVASQAYAVKHGYPVLEHVTLPRIGAMLTLLDILSSNSKENGIEDLAGAGDTTTADSVIHTTTKKSLKYVIDVTIAYPDGRPLDLFCMIFGNRDPCQTTVHYRRYAIEDVPRTEDVLLPWMYNRWAEKDELLAHFYETGLFPVSSQTANGAWIPRNDKARALPMDNAWCLSLNVIFILSTYFHLSLLCKVASAVIGFF